MNPRVAIIGCGRITMESHLPAWQAAVAAGRCSLIGVTDLDPTRAQRAAAQARVPAYPSVEALLDQAHPDIVLIATLLDRHHDLAIQALEAGCHVLCEKPIARNASEASAMVDAATRAGRLLSICFQYRSLPEVRYLRDRLASGDFGAILSIRTWGTDVRGLPVNRPWPRGGGGALNHFTSHNLDLVLWLLGFPAVVSASAVGWQRLPRIGVAAVPMTGGLQRADAVPPDIEDLGHALVRFADGSALTVEANWLARPSARPTGWEVLTERGAASLMPLGLWRDDGDAWIDLTPPEGTLAPPPVGMSGLIDDFLAAVEAGGPAPVDGPEIVAVQQLVDALYASIESGLEVRLAQG